ncbi:MAG TPA: hypothetical protein VMB79_06195 [Jatrophihabitans sp.]|nr:hypothetical protein [Jatrophihabitans sp.]
MRTVIRVTLAAGLALFLAAVVVLLWPLRADGVTGSALRPHYAGFGWTTFVPLPPHPTEADLRAAGVPLPQDAVAHRRHVARALGLPGLALTAAGVILWAVRAPRQAG